MPREALPNFCAECGALMTGPTAGQRKFCGDECRRKAAARKKDNTAKGLATVEVTEPAKDLRKTLKDLGNDEGLLDEIRDTMRDEVRNSITQYVRDRVLGAVELLTSMGPVAMAQLFKDLQSESWPERSRAYAIWFKYVMPLMESDTDKADLKNINVVIGNQELNIPDTRIGNEFVELADGVEYYERDWPVCYGCNVRKHPEAGRSIVHLGQDQFQCFSCAAQEAYEKGDTLSATERDPYG